MSGKYFTVSWEREVRGRPTAVPEGEGQVDEGFLADSLAGRVVLLHDVVDLADCGGDEPNESVDCDNVARVSQHELTYKDRTKARMYQCLDQK